VAYNLARVGGTNLLMSPLLQAGLNLTAIGMGVVFVLLGLLVGIIRGMSALSRRIEALFPQPQTSSPGGAPSPAAEQQIVSVISAAIAAHRKTR